MPIGQSIQKPREAHQSMLAKLLAKENITVRFGNYSTAFFEPKSRVLGMPMWNAESKQVSDLLVGHEVGHALYTPQDGIERFRARFPGLPFDICNVIEDVRIERMIQSTYPGLVHSFREGYRSFVAKDLFKINGVDLSKLSVADRINLHAKIGHLVDVPLTAEEKVVYAAAYSAETFDDVLNVCQDLYDLVEKSQDPNQGEEDDPKAAKAEKNQGGQSGSSTQVQSSESSQQSDSDSQSEGASSDSDSADGAKKEGKKPNGNSSKKEPKPESDSDGAKQESESESGSSHGDADDTSGEHGDGDDETESGDDSANAAPQPSYSPDMSKNFAATHQREFDKGTAEMQENIETTLVNVPTPGQMLRCVTPLDKVLAERRLDSKYDEMMSNVELNDSHRKFKDSTKKHVQILIKEFERRKAAYQYSRARQSTNGTIDVNRLHAYRYEDQIFRSVTTLAEAKNHGMAFFIDYSGSMGRTIGAVIEQTIQLVTFCKAVNIPFVVYGFTSGFFSDRDHSSAKYAPGLSINFDGVNVFEILNSSLRKSEFDKCIKEMYAMSFYRRMFGIYSYHANSTYILFKSRYEAFGGTPLIETVIVASELVKRFRAAHNVQKMSTTFLTDGDPCGVHLHDNFVDREFRKNTERWSSGLEMRYGKENINWTTQYPKNAMAAAIRAFRNVTQSTVIGYFIADNQRAFKSHCIDAMRNTNHKVADWSSTAEKFKTHAREIRSNGGIFAIKDGGGYDMFFAFDSRDALDMNADDDFDTKMDMDNLDNAAAQNKLAKEFTKFSSSKKSSRVFVHKFAEMIG